MVNIPQDLGGYVDRTLCSYTGYFPELKCILCKCKKCSSSKFYNEIFMSNRDKVTDKQKCFLIKQWVTQTVKKEETTQSFLHWKFER